MQTRAELLPTMIPFRAPARGQRITNGSNGTYFIGDHIGSGAFGDVYECTDEWSNALVAKVFKPGFSFEEVRAHWESEVANLTRLRHPNITYIHDAFAFNNAFYIIVEKCLYSLDRVLARVDASWVPHIARDILQALAFIHRHGYVHKDVHPGNVFVSLTSDAMAGTGTGDGTPYPSFKLGDLGISRLEHEIRSIGTVLAPWMRPPEALLPAHFGVIGRPTDVYHAALMLLCVLRREVFSFSEDDVVAGRPQQLALQAAGPYAVALGNALHPQVAHRTQTPLELWRQLQTSLLSG